MDDEGDRGFNWNIPFMAAIVFCVLFWTAVVLLVFSRFNVIGG